MEEIQITDKVVFSVFCPYLGRTVYLKRGTWHGKIIIAHGEVENRLELIKEVLTKDNLELSILRKKNNANKIAIFKKCPHLLPYHKYIKIALELISEKQAVVTTVQGINNIPLDMEEIK